MAFNGYGTFNRLYSWVTDKANGIFVNATRMDAEMDGMAMGLSTCLTKDGQTTPTANIPMGGFKITGLLAGVAATDAANVGQIAAAAAFYDAGNSAAALTLSPANGQFQQFTLTNNATITLNNATIPGWYYFKCLQDATGSRSLTWAGASYSANRWVNNAAAPAAAGTASGAVYFAFFWDGTVWWQMYLGAVARKARYIMSATRDTTAQTFAANSTFNTLIFNTANVDTYSEYGTGTGIFTAKVSGVYAVHATVAMKQSVTGSLIVDCAITGGAYTVVLPSNGVIISGTGYIFLQIALCVPLAAGGTIKLRGYGDGGGTVTMDIATSLLQITRIGDVE